MKRGDQWEFLWLKYHRVGYVEQMSIFGLTFWARCGNVRQLFGISWVKQ